MLYRSRRMASPVGPHLHSPQNSSSKSQTYPRASLVETWVPFRVGTSFSTCQGELAHTTSPSREGCVIVAASSSSGNGQVQSKSSDRDDEDKKNAEESLKEKRIQAERKRAREKKFDPEAFHLPTAIALGCCSFEAYNAPYQSFGVKEVSPCGSEIIFVDHDFLQNRTEGILEVSLISSTSELYLLRKGLSIQVHLRRATGLSSVADEDSSDEKKQAKLPTTRCRVLVHPSSGFSETYQASLDPVWRQTFFLYVQDQTSQKLEVIVEAVTNRKGNKIVELGCAEIENLGELCDGEIHNLVLPLKREGKASGQEVHLSVRFQAKDQERNLLRSIKGQAVGQMINDDWCSGVSHEWETGDDDSDWRYVGIPGGPEFAVLSDEEPIDIEGGELAEGQPLSRQPWKEWSQLRQFVVEEHGFPTMTPIAFVMNKETDTELWMYTNWEARKIAISFRGTSSPKDMLTDMSLDLAAFNPEGDDASKQPEEVAADISEKEWEEGPFGGLYKALKTVEKLPVTHAINKLLIKTAKGKKRNSVTKGLSGWAKAQMMMLYALEHDHKWCHNGFLQAYTSVSQAVVMLVDEIMSSKKDKEGERWQVYLTGHSMGGALCTLCAYELSKRGYQGMKTPEITMYSFGQPRVGNQPFANAYGIMAEYQDCVDEAVPDTWRIKNAEDIVTTVPGLLGYTHIGNEVMLTSEGEVTVSCVSTDNVREGEFIADLIPKLKDGMTGEDSEMQNELKQLMMGEVDMMKAILKGNGVSQHMEDVYHNYLQGCSKKGGDFAAPIRDAVRDAKERLQLPETGGKILDEESELPEVQSLRESGWRIDTDYIWNAFQKAKDKLWSS